MAACRRRRVTLEGMKQCDSRRGFTLIEALVTIVLVVIISACLWFSLFRSRCGEYAEVRCAIHLKQLYSFSLLYSDRKGRGFHPVAPGEAPQAHESLQLLANFLGDIDPRLFTCPYGNAVPAQRDSKSGEVVLAASNVDYAWTAMPVSNQTAAAVLCSDKYVDGHVDANGVMHGGHKGGFNVLRSDGSVSFVVESDAMITEDKLPKGLVR